MDSWSMRGRLRIVNLLLSFLLFSSAQVRCDHASSGSALLTTSRASSSTTPTFGRTVKAATKIAASGGRCGATFNARCPGKECCSQYSYCGTSKAHCGTKCQKLWGTCTGVTPQPQPAPQPAPQPQPQPQPAPGPSGCPAGWLPAVGTVYDSWPQPGTKECIDYSGCQWAGMFSRIDSGPCSGPCSPGAQPLDGGNGKVCCRWPEATVRRWNIAATYDKDSALLGRQLQVIVQGKPGTVATVNVKDVCSDSDCEGCCSTNTGNAKWKLLDIEKWPASVLLGFNPSTAGFDINNVNVPSVKSTGFARVGAPADAVMPLCYKDVGAAP